METLDYYGSWPAWPAWEVDDVLLVAILAAWVLAGWWNFAPDIERLRRARRRRLAEEAVAAEAAVEQTLPEQGIAAETESPDQS